MFMKNNIKKYTIYGLIVVFGLVIKDLFKNFDNYSFGFLVGAIASIPLWVNYYDERSHRGYTISGLESLLSNFASSLNWWNYDSNEEIMAAKKEYYNKLMSYMQRELTDYEKEYIKEDYFDEDEQQEN